jgi:hypothetical protein
MPFRRAKHARSPDGIDQDASAVGQGEPAEQSDGSMDVLLDAFHSPAEPGAEHPSTEEQSAAAVRGSGATVAEAAPEPRQGWLRRARLAFRRWRRTRPFWAGLWCLLGGAIIIYGPLTVIRFVLIAGTVVWAGILIGALVCVMGLFMWFSPQLPKVLGILAVLFSIVSLVTSNFGGFLIGMLFGVIGGSMAFAWTPLPAAAAAVGAPPATPQPPQSPEPGTQEKPATPRPDAGATTRVLPPASTESGSPASPAHGEDPLARARD